MCYYLFIRLVQFISDHLKEMVEASSLPEHDELLLEYRGEYISLIVDKSEGIT